MKKELSLAALVCCLFSCTQQQTFRIEGYLPDNSYDNRTMHLMEHDAVHFEREKLLATALIQNGQFVMDFPLEEDPKVAYLELPDTEPTDLFSVISQAVIVEKGTVTVKYDSLGVIMQGTPLNDRYNELLLQEKRNIRKETDKIIGERALKEKNGSLSPSEYEPYNARINALHVAYRPLHTQFTKENIDDAVGTHFLYRFPLESYSEADRAYLTSRVDKASLQAYNQKMDSIKQARRYFDESQKQMTEGHRYRDVIGFDPDGNPVKLSDYVKPGRIMLIDFWASWCKPCIQEIPFLKELYKKYHDKGLDIVSFSFDTKKEAWLGALEKYPMEWPQMSDLQGWKGNAPKDYGINAISFVVLLDQNGNIKVRNLHAHLLENAIKELLGL